MKLEQADIAALLPGHIACDGQFAAAASAANPVILSISRAIPRLLLWARLGGQEPATFLPPLRRLAEARGGLEPLDMETLESLAWQFHVDFREAAKDRQTLAAHASNPCGCAPLVAGSPALQSGQCFYEG